MSQISTQQPSQKDQSHSDPHYENIQAIVELHERAEKGVSRQQRTIEKITNFLGRPIFLFIILAFVVLWIIVNIVLIKFRVSAFDPPPFIWLVSLLTLGALLQTTMILITQNHEDLMMERRTQLDLQISLILDEKVSKLLVVVDQLRQVHPDLDNGDDAEVETLKKTVDPHESVKALDRSLKSKVDPK